MTNHTAYHHGNLRAALVDEGLEQLERNGLDDLSLRALAESLGVSKTAPYRHFQTKRDLFSALAAEGYSRFADMLEEYEPKLMVLDPQRRMAEMQRIYAGFAQRQPELYRLMFSRLGNSLHSERCKVNAQRAFGVLVRFAESLLSTGADSRALALSIFASLHGWMTILMDDLIPPEVGVNVENWEEFSVFPSFYCDTRCTV